MDATQLKAALQRQKNKIIISAIFGNMGSSIFSFGLSLLILKETGSATNFGISFVIGPVLAVIFMPFIGGLVDKYDRKKIALFAQAVVTAAVLLFALLYHLENIPKLLLVYGIIIVMKMTDIIFATAYVGAMSRMVEKEQQLSLMSVMNIISSANMLIASFLGAVMYESLPFLLFILFEAATEFISLIITASLDFTLLAEEPSEEEEEIEQQSVFALFVSGLYDCQFYFIAQENTEKLFFKCQKAFHGDVGKLYAMGGADADSVSLLEQCRHHCFLKSDSWFFSGHDCNAA